MPPLRVTTAAIMEPYSRDAATTAGAPRALHSMTSEGKVRSADGAEYFDAREFSQRASIEEEHYWHVHRRMVLLEVLRALTPPETTGRLLEIGCGIGTVTTYLNANGYVVDYGDFFEDAIAIARQRAEKRLGAAAVAERRFLRVDATRPLELSGYQGMLLFDVIEHLPDDALVLRHVRRALAEAPGAFVMIAVPAFDFLWSPWDDIERHKRRYTRRKLGRLLDRTGFTLVRSSYFFAPLFFAAIGVKGLRKVRDAFAPAPGAENIGDLLETRTSDLLNRVVLGVHRPERRWLAARRALPFGTSLLALARAR